MPYFFEYPNPSHWVVNRKEVQIVINKSEKEHARFGDTTLDVLRVRPQYLKKNKDNALTDELGIPRTREAYALAGGERGHERKCGFSPCFLGQKAWRGV
jgi:hypothetical protein